LGRLVTQVCDVLIVGSGIAGASAAYEIAAGAKVMIAEAERQPGAQATGRSAALFHVIYGGPVVQKLSRAALPFFLNPPAGFTAAPLLTPRGLLMVAPEGGVDELERHASQAPDEYRRLTPDDAEALWPALRKGFAVAAAYDDSAKDIDVDALLQGFLRGARARGALLTLAAKVTAIRREGKGWRVSCGSDEVSCAAIIDAAGAWGDEVAKLAGVRPIGLSPKRRTAALVDAPPDSQAWPILIDVGESFYAKPSAGRLLVSPADETDVAPHDAYPDDEALAAGIERLEAATSVRVTRKPTAWAGLRTFTTDRLPAIGEDPETPGFFWLVGQGGFGVQTSPAVASLAAALVLRHPLPPRLTSAGVRAEDFNPARLRRG
jgi:D-arginine dehydrogenase